MLPVSVFALLSAHLHAAWTPWLLSTQPSGPFEVIRTLGTGLKLRGTS